MSNAEPNATSFDLAVLQFKDDGSFLEPSQVNSVEDCIGNARASTANDNGAMVVVFIHGWHHGASWNRTATTAANNPDGDDHFHSFRLILEGLALREAERYVDDGKPAGRRVLGIYISWNGDPEKSFLKGIPGVRHLSFWDRYEVAEKIGGHFPFRDSIRRIIRKTKQPLTGSEDKLGRFTPESPLVLIGHSMDALMLQSAMAAILEDHQQPLELQESQSAGAEIRSGSTLVSFPDLILSLNSAADSLIAKRILAEVERRSIKKIISIGDIRYCPPLLVSVTSIGDKDTGETWELVKRGKTDGNDSSLFTHVFSLGTGEVSCQPANTVDYGQNWHCLRRPYPPDTETPSIPIDLPTRDRNGIDDRNVPHVRCVIAPKGDRTTRQLMWVFQVPQEIIRDHNDIFNSRASSLILGLIQLSGATASIATRLEDIFEP